MPQPQREQFSLDLASFFSPNSSAMPTPSFGRETAFVPAPIGTAPLSHIRPSAVTRHPSAAPAHENRRTRHRHAFLALGKRAVSHRNTAITFSVTITVASWNDRFRALACCPNLLRTPCHMFWKVSQCPQFEVLFFLSLTPRANILRDGAGLHRPFHLLSPKARVLLLHNLGQISGGKPFFLFTSS